MSEAELSLAPYRLFVALSHVRRARIGVDVSQHAQGVVGVLGRHSGGLLALFP